MPSALSTSRLYSISRRLPSVSGNGITANERKRPGWSRSRLAAYSLQARASLRDSSSTLPNHTPGLMIEVIEVAMPALSMSSSDMAGDHLVGLVLRWLVSAWACTGGTMWWWTSMRCGLAGAWASAGVAAKAERPAPIALMPPATKARRLMGWRAGAALGSQQRHRAKDLRRLVALMARSLLGFSCCSYSVRLQVRSSAPWGGPPSPRRFANAQFGWRNRLHCRRRASSTCERSERRRGKVPVGGTSQPHRRQRRISQH